MKEVSYLVHEAALARAERVIKRLFIALCIAIVALFACNALWLYAWMQYDYESTEVSTVYSQTGEGTNIIGEGNTNHVAESCDY